MRDSENSRAAWEAAVAPLFGPSGFTRVFSLDTGQITSWYGKPAKGPEIVRECRLHISRRVVEDVAVPQTRWAAA